MKKVTISVKVSWWVSPFAWVCGQVYAAALTARLINERQWDVLCDKGADFVIRHGIKFKAA